MIIGLTGKNASGKGEAANYLKSKGFVYYSLSDVLREEAAKRNLAPARDNLIELGNELRKKYGPGCLAQQINNKIKEQSEKSSIKTKTKLRGINKKNKKINFVVDSIRSPYEAKELMKNKDFILIGIDAPIETRFERLLKRNRLGDAKTLEGFRQQEQRENLKTSTNQQLDETFKLSEKVILNDGSLKQLHKYIDDLLLQLNCEL
ncbi:AAA family ATPase [Candidatus Woesearchaeota archaeon]|nr:AAA family ATPase [Candidatus Woesearchaeota archaeon]